MSVENSVFKDYLYGKMQDIQSIFEIVLISSGIFISNMELQIKIKI